MKAISLVIATVIMLAGCGMADSETVVPGVAPDTTEINFGLIPGGLPAGFYDDAEEHAGQAVERYIAVTSVLVDKGCHSETLVSGRC